MLGHESLFQPLVQRLNERELARARSQVLEIKEEGYFHLDKEDWSIVFGENTVRREVRKGPKRVKGSFTGLTKQNVGLWLYDYHYGNYNAKYQI